MSLSRMVVLGLLAEGGPMYGHQLRRQADSMHVESWGGVSPGALNRELHQLEAEGLIERSEQIGRVRRSTRNHSPQERWDGHAPGTRTTSRASAAPLHKP
jgi:DNA-binding PadR family transcriptional regulator